MSTRKPCRDCGLEILWTTVVGDDGKRIPVEPYPDPDGTVAIRKAPQPGLWFSYVVTQRRPLVDGWKLVRNHIAYCPARKKSDPPPPRGDDNPQPTLI